MPKFSIRYNPGRSQKKPWQLDLGLVRQPDGSVKRKWEYFSTEPAAEAAKEIRLRMVKRHGERAVEFTLGQQTRWAEAESKLAEVGATIEDAVELMRTERRALKEKITLGELVERAKAAEIGGRFLSASWDAFVEGREDLEAARLPPEEVEEWLDGEEWATKTRRNNLTNLSSMFRWAMHRKRGLVTRNPCIEVEIEDEDSEEEVTCATPAQARALLESTLKYAPLLLYKPVLGFFTGIRSEELHGLEPPDIEVDGAVVVVRAEVAKGGRAGRKRRALDMPASAVEWMRLWQKARGEALSAWHERRAWWSARRVAGWWLRPVRRMKAGSAEIQALMERPRQPSEEPWPRNLIRHTFASMHYAQHGDEKTLARLMGHEDEGDTFHRRYKAVRMLDGKIITRAVAAEFWAIRP